MSVKHGTHTGQHHTGHKHHTPVADSSNTAATTIQNASGEGATSGILDTATTVVDASRADVVAAAPKVEAAVVDATLAEKVDNLTKQVEALQASATAKAVNGPVNLELNCGDQKAVQEVIAAPTVVDTAPAIAVTPKMPGGITLNTASVAPAPQLA